MWTVLLLLVSAARADVPPEPREDPLDSGCVCTTAGAAPVALVLGWLPLVLVRRRQD